ncbi:hypothetical protein B0H13DRAFT_2677954 [Mycena leptocephala]|nr:hypothetical protein B0H13DRAFT_2677954 [Mycena leptocephala]
MASHGPTRDPDTDRQGPDTDKRAATPNIQRVRNLNPCASQRRHPHAAPTPHIDRRRSAFRRPRTPDIHLKDGCVVRSRSIRAMRAPWLDAPPLTNTIEPSYAHVPVVCTALIPS